MFTAFSKKWPVFARFLKRNLFGLLPASKNSWRGMPSGLMLSNEPKRKRCVGPFCSDFGKARQKCLMCAPFLVIENYIRIFPGCCQWNCSCWPCAEANDMWNQVSITAEIVALCLWFHVWNLALIFMCCEMRRCALASVFPYFNCFSYQQLTYNVWFRVILHIDSYDVTLRTAHNCHSEPEPFIAIPVM